MDTGEEGGGQEEKEAISLKDSFYETHKKRRKEGRRKWDRRE